MASRAWGIGDAAYPRAGGGASAEARAEALGDAEAARAAATAVDELNVSPADEGQHAPRHEGAAV